MNGTVIVALVAVLALIDLFRLRAKGATLSRAGLLVASIARALLPVAASVAIGCWQLIRSFEGIAETGHGGLGVVAVPAEHLVRTLLAGIIAFVVTLTVAWVLAARARMTESPETTPTGGRRSIAAAVGSIAVMLAIGGTWIAMNSADKFAVGMIASLAGRTGVFVPAGAPPPPRFAPPPSAYAAYAAMSGQEMARQSERLMTSRTSGLVITGLLVGLCLATSRLFSRAWLSGGSWTWARGTVVALIVAAGWYAVRLGTGVSWLRSVVAG